MTSQSRAIRRQSRKIVKSEKIMAQTFFNYKSTCDSTDVPASMYDRKTAANLLNLSTTFYNLLSKAEVRQFSGAGIVQLIALIQQNFNLSVHSGRGKFGRSELEAGHPFDLRRP